MGNEARAYAVSLFLKQVLRDAMDTNNASVIQFARTNILPKYISAVADTEGYSVIDQSLVDQYEKYAPVAVGTDFGV